MFDPIQRAAYARQQLTERFKLDSASDLARIKDVRIAQMVSGIHWGVDKAPENWEGIDALKEATLMHLRIFGY